ncbi:hypothetical protein JL722_4428 [Aureococcus anophagefferens]|nr:hypothetical protein JL722_4428 [Aureococcus anophagefferens]
MGRKLSIACVAFVLLCWLSAVRDLVALHAAPPPPPVATGPAVTPAFRRLALRHAWRAPGDLGGDCRRRPVVANAHAAGRPCDVKRPPAAKLAENRGRRNVVLAEAVCREAGTAEFLGAGYRLKGGLADHLRATREQVAKAGGKWRNWVPCRPFGAMLRAAGFGPDRPVDFASVDVEGAEHVVAETMDFGVPVRTWLVEALDRDRSADSRDAENVRRVRAALLGHGYREAAHFNVTQFCDEVAGFGLRSKEHPCTTNLVFERPDLVWDLAAVDAGDAPAPDLERPLRCGCEDLARAIARWPTSGTGGTPRRGAPSRWTGRR